MKSLAKNSAYNVLYYLVNSLFPLISTMYASRILLSDGMGRIGYAQNIVSYFFTFAGFGISVYGVREVAKIRDNQQSLDRLFTELVLINAITTTISLVSYLILIFFNKQFQKDVVLFSACGMQLALNYMNIDWLYQGCEDYKYISIRNMLIKIASVIAVLLFVKEKSDYTIYALISSFGLGMNYAVNVFMSRRIVKPVFRAIQLNKHIKSLIILALIVFFSSAYNRVDVTMLGGMCSESEIGLYNGAHRIIDIIVSLTASISMVFLPRFSYLFATNRNDFDKLLETGILIVSFISIPMFLGLLVLAPQLMIVFYGESFTGGGLTLQLFSPIVIIKSFANLVCYQMIVATGKERTLLKACVVATIINVVLNSFLIPLFQQNGAAFASVLSELTVDIIQLVFLRKVVIVRFPIREMTKNLLSGVIMTIVMIFVGRMISSVLLRVIIQFIAGSFTFFLMSYLVKADIIDFVVKKVKRTIFLRKKNKTGYY